MSCSRAGCMHESGASRDTEPVGYRTGGEIYSRELAHTSVEAEQSHNWFRETTC